jgi:hypothetical protein
LISIPWTRYSTSRECVNKRKLAMTKCRSAGRLRSICAQLALRRTLSGLDSIRSRIALEFAVKGTWDDMARVVCAQMGQRSKMNEEVAELVSLMDATRGPESGKVGPL